MQSYSRIYELQEVFLFVEKIEFAIVLLLLAVLIMMSNHLEEMVSSGRVTERNPCIVLDSGHGGEDPGKNRCEIRQKKKDVNLKIAKKDKRETGEKGMEGRHDKRKGCNA